jgi:hypothetical protein
VLQNGFNNISVASVPERVAILVFAESLQNDLQRRGFGARHASLLQLPKLADINADLHWFCDRAPPRRDDFGQIHRQRGHSFGQKLENAVDELARLGYARVIIVGRDCPQLAAGDVSRAIELLDTRRAVIGPDHRGGCWLIGLHTADRALLRGIRWQQNTDARQLAARFAEADLALLETKIDVDSVADVRRLARIGWFAFDLGIIPAVAPVLRCLRQLCHLRRFLQLPPPVCSIV